ncbi:hypothetical protein I6J39_16865 [Streptomyces californicus]|uniref:Uncharacterized protein n=1 Tax=Streptomyces californicus TaxID=67351 RepID=A0ABX7J4V6_9ACTN|nr:MULTISPECIES: hypothetical protein [Streptomyces]QRV28795.1 hypothetical protein I6J39_16865 [Streptomyces californicus]QRV42209.1 hypothetical protein I6J41_16780 [Streptomyces californicus]
MAPLKPTSTGLTHKTMSIGELKRKNDQSQTARTQEKTGSAPISQQPKGR